MGLFLNLENMTAVWDHGGQPKIARNPFFCNLMILFQEVLDKLLAKAFDAYSKSVRITAAWVKCKPSLFAEWVFSSPEGTNFLEHFYGNIVDVLVPAKICSNLKPRYPALWTLGSGMPWLRTQKEEEQFGDFCTGLVRLTSYLNVSRRQFMCKSPWDPTSIRVAKHSVCLTSGS